MRPAHLLAGTVVFVGIAFGVLGGEYTAIDHWKLRQEAEDLRQIIDSLRLEIDSLTALADSLESDSATIERVAREKLGMMRDGELLLRFE